MVELRLNGGRVLVRPSGTEPKLKVYVDLSAEVGESDAVGALEASLAEAARSVAAGIVTTLGPLP